MTGTAVIAVAGSLEAAVGQTPSVLQPLHSPPSQLLIATNELLHADIIPAFHRVRVVHASTLPHFPEIEGQALRARVLSDINNNGFAVDVISDALRRELETIQAAQEQWTAEGIGHRVASYEVHLHEGLQRYPEVLEDCVRKLGAQLNSHNFVVYLQPDLAFLKENGVGRAFFDVIDEVGQGRIGIRLVTSNLRQTALDEAKEICQDASLLNIPLKLVMPQVAGIPTNCFLNREAAMRYVSFLGIDAELMNRTLLPGAVPYHRTSSGRDFHLRYPLHPIFDGNGVHFSAVAPLAERVEVLKFDRDRKQIGPAIPFEKSSPDVWTVYSEDFKPGDRYGFRVHGPFDQSRGRFFDSRVTLLDPNARHAVEHVSDQHKGFLGVVHWPDLVEHHPIARPSIGLDKMVVYELHVKNLTKLHALVPERDRGTLAGLCAPAVVDHIKRMGFNTVEIMPCHLTSEPGWGYMPASFNAFRTDFAKGKDEFAARRELKGVVDTYHMEGLAVVLDVVFNHTAEKAPHAPHLGPLLSWRGMHPQGYRMNDKGEFGSESGCGNVTNIDDEHMLLHLIDSLRYYAREFRFDGFRLDQASLLAWSHGRFDVKPFFELVQKDPELSKLRIVVEPFAPGPADHPHRQGEFGPGIIEWNGAFRPDMRRFWRGDAETLASFATRLYGSSDLFEGYGKTPLDAMNFLACHDGFTLRDSVMYSHRTNLDGHDGEVRWDARKEAQSPAHEADYVERILRSEVLSLFVSAGIPLWRAGDELLQTQYGNDNAYDQDNETVYQQWCLDQRGVNFKEFVAYCIAFRQAHPILRRDRYDLGDAVQWINPRGAAMQPDDWKGNQLGCVLKGVSLDGTPETLLLLVNNSNDTKDFILPQGAQAWKREVDTSFADAFRDRDSFDAGKAYALQGKSFVIFSLE